MCDDVRIENNGKYLLIGAYPLNVVAVRSLQLPVTFCCYLEMKTDMREHAVGQSRIINDKEDTIFAEGFNLALRPSGLNYMFFYGVTFVANHEGEFKFQWQFGAGDWLDITSLRIEMGKSPQS